MPVPIGNLGARLLGALETPFARAHVLRQAVKHLAANGPYVNDSQRLAIQAILRNHAPTMARRELKARATALAERLVRQMPNEQVAAAGGANRDALRRMVVREIMRKGSPPSPAAVPPPNVYGPPNAPGGPGLFGNVGKPPNAIPLHGPAPQAQSGPSALAKSLHEAAAGIATTGLPGGAFQSVAPVLAVTAPAPVASLVGGWLEKNPKTDPRDVQALEAVDALLNDLKTQGRNR